MYMIIIWLLNGWFFSVYKTKEEIWNSNGFEFFLFFSYSFFGILIGSFLGFLFALMMPSKLENKVYTYKLEPIQSSNSYINSTVINDKLNYFYYYKEKNSIHMNQIVSSDNVLIKYDDMPRVEIYKEEKIKDEFINNFSINTHCVCSDNIIIYIPNSSVIQNKNN